MNLRIALAGNPNSGKTTLFNELTGNNQYVGNWPGVTVEKKEGRVKGNKQILLQDLPGVYSLSPYTLEEVVARDYLVNDKPDAILNIVDASNLERNLYLTTQLLELGIPMVVALNMMDIVRKNGDIINIDALSKKLGCPVVETSALKGEGCLKAVEAAASAAANKGIAAAVTFSDPVERALENLSQAIGELAPSGRGRWFCIKLFERDSKLLAGKSLPKAIEESVSRIIAACEDAMDDDSESIITNERYTYISGLIKGCLKKQRKPGHLSASDKIDRIVTHRILALPIFAAIMTLVYFIAVTTVGAIVTDFTNDTLFGEWIIPAVESGLANLPEGMAWLGSLVASGIVGGVGAVLGFVPQMLILFILLAILEDIGYMARVAFIMDRIFRRFGLSGKSFIPMLIGSGCSVPGIMASRTIENQRDRRMTVMTTSFIPCGAKLPIIATIAGAVMGGAWWVAPGAYFLGVASVVVSGIMLKKTKPFAGDPAPFVMELPKYHRPAPSNVLRSMWERGWSFVKRAGTVILLASVVIWFLGSFGMTDDGFGMTEDMDDSVLAVVGEGIAPVFTPLGFGHEWEPAVATVMGLVAKEEVIGAFGVLYGLSDDALALAEEESYDELSPIAEHFTPLQAIAFMIFNLLCAPCFAAIGAIRREMNNWRWTAFAVGYLCVFAYIISLIVYQLGLLLSGGGFTALTAIAFALIALLVFLLVRPYSNKTGGRAIPAAV